MGNGCFWKMHFPASFYFLETMFKNRLPDAQPAVVRLRERGKNFPGPFPWVDVYRLFIKKNR